MFCTLMLWSRTKSKKQKQIYAIQCVDHKGQGKETLLNIQKIQRQKQGFQRQRPCVDRFRHRRPVYAHVLLRRGEHLRIYWWRIYWKKNHEKFTKCSVDNSALYIRVKYQKRIQEKHLKTNKPGFNHTSILANQNASLTSRYSSQPIMCFFCTLDN